jgi:hypothetical protein
MRRLIERRGPRDIAENCIGAKHSFYSTRRIICRGQVFEDFTYGIHGLAKLAGTRRNWRIAAGRRGTTFCGGAILVRGYAVSHCDFE